MSKLHWLLSVLSLLAACVVCASGQPPFAFNAEAEREFSKGVQLLKNGEYAGAESTFTSIAALTPVHQRTTAALVMVGKVRFQLAKYRESAGWLVSFLRQYPMTNYSDDSRYTLALDYLMLQWFDESALQFLRCLETTDDPKLYRMADSLFELIADEHLAQKNLEQLLPKLLRPDSKSLVKLKLAEKYSTTGSPSMVRAMLDEVLVLTPSGHFAERAKNLEQKLSASALLKIGVALPLMRNSSAGGVKAIASELLDGIQFAVEEYRKTPDAARPIMLEVRDTDRDSATAVHAVQELCGMSETIAIIGPLFSNIVLHCAPIAEQSGISMITPTATANGIASTGRHIFQANPDYSIRGKALARYAVEQLGLKSLAILATQEPMGKMLAESFSLEAAKLGATIIRSESYSKGATDLREQFINIRTAGLMMSGDSSSAGRLDVPVTAIQGLYIPVADGEEIGVIASQIVYFNIKTQILGSPEWYDPVQLEANRRYLNGIIFAADYFIDKGDSTTIEFDRKFVNTIRKHPTRYTLIGYDTMKLIVDQVRHGADTRDKLTQALAGVKEYRALHSKVTLSQGRVNTVMQILKYSGGEITKLTDISSE